MFLSWYQDVPTLVSLIVFATITLAGVGASIVRHRLTHPGAAALGEPARSRPPSSARRNCSDPRRWRTSPAASRHEAQPAKSWCSSSAPLVVLVLLAAGGVAPGAGWTHRRRGRPGHRRRRSSSGASPADACQEQDQKVADSNRCARAQNAGLGRSDRADRLPGLVALLVYMARCVPASWTLGLKPHGAKITRQAHHRDRGQAHRRRLLLGVHDGAGWRGGARETHCTRQRSTAA